LRAGLLSQPEVIEEINEKFVSTWTVIDEATKLAEKGDPLGKTLASSWEYPVDLMFLTPEGKLVSKLNSYKDFKDVHPDTAVPPGKYRLAEGEVKRSHIEVFQNHVAAFLAGRRQSTGKSTP
jgi:hypothetical protein